MKLTSKNLFVFSNEVHDDRDSERDKAMSKIRSPVFKKLMDDLKRDPADQDYERFLDLINLISKNIGKVPDQKKAFETILSPDYLKDMDTSDTRDKVYKDLFTIYEVIKKKIKG